MGNYQLYLQIGYTLFLIIVLFLLRSKWPNRYSIGCLLCLIAPSWGQFYKKSKYNWALWMFFMVIELGVTKASGPDSTSSILLLLMLGVVSSSVMFYRILSNNISLVANLDNAAQDNIPVEENDESSNNIIDMASDDTMPDNISTDITGISKIGIALGLMIAIITAVLVIGKFDDYKFNSFANSANVISIVILSSAIMGLVAYGLSIIIYRIILWNKYEILKGKQFDFKSILLINNRILLLIFISMLILLGAQTAYLFKHDTRTQTTALIAPEEKNLNEIMSNIACDELLKEADGIRNKLEKYKQINGRYPVKLSDVYIDPFIKLDTKNINNTKYSISLSDDGCNKIYSIESNRPVVLYRMAK